MAKYSFHIFSRIFVKGDDGGFLFKLCHTRDEQQQRENPKHLSGWTARRTTMASNTYLPTPSDEQQRWHPHRKGSFERRTGATSVWKWSLRNQATNKSQWPVRVCIYGEEPFVASLETSTFGSPGGGKESVYRLYLVTTVYYFARI